MLIAAQIIVILIIVASVAYLAATGFGLHLIKQGQRPFDAAALEADGGKYITTSDGRVVEYFVSGSTDRAAKVVVNLHGSGTEAMEQHRLYAPICEALGIRGIAIGLPGYGFSDMQPGRQVKNWPIDDLDAVFAQEGVDTFMITGHSQGNPHAMAAAYHFGDRCEGLGLYAPLLPADLCKEIGIEGAIGMNSLPTTDALRKWYMAWYFTVFHLSLVVFSPWLALKSLERVTPKLSQEPKLKERFRDSIQRANIRGSVGGAWESAFDVCFEWGFDPRLIPTKNVCVWHAADDNLCPPEHGRWLAEMFQDKDGVKVNYRADNQGYGHFTYSRGEFIEAENSLINALLEGCS
jgi:pimeloyl-ACP methyl ester carboxylesterase